MNSSVADRITRAIHVVHSKGGKPRFISLSPPDVRAVERDIERLYPMLATGPCVPLQINGVSVREGPRGAPSYVAWARHQFEWNAQVF